MANFSDFVKEHKTQQFTTSGKTNEELEDMINKYSELSEDKLMNEFVKLTLEKKRRGELSSAELESLKKTLSPMLNESQKLSLDKLFELVKRV